MMALFRHFAGEVKLLEILLESLAALFCIDNFKYLWLTFKW